MKQAIINETILALMVLAPLCIQAQGTLYISNLGQTPTGRSDIGSNFWIAQEYITGNNSDGYSLDSVQLLMNAASGSPTGFAVSVYSKTGDPHSASNGDSPLADIGNFNGSADPSAGGLFAYSSDGLSLASHTFYFIVVTSATSVASGSYVWSAANSFTQDPNTLWTIEDAYFSSVNGSSWDETLRQNVFQMAIYATPVPEPQTEVLLGLGLVCLGLLSRQRK